MRTRKLLVFGKLYCLPGFERTVSTVQLFEPVPQERPRDGIVLAPTSKDQGNVVDAHLAFDNEVLDRRLIEAPIPPGLFGEETRSHREHGRDGKHCDQYLHFQPPCQTEFDLYTL